MRSIFISKQRKGLFVNMIGLVVGVSASIMILLFVQYENSYDKHIENYQDIYRVRTITSKDGELTMNSVLASPPMGPTIMNSFPEVKDFVRIYTERDCIFEVNQQEFEVEDVAFVDNSIFSIFTIPLISGDPKVCLVEPNTAVLSQSLGRKFFGDDNPVGRSIKLNNEFVFQITGVYLDMPQNTHFQSDILLSYATPNWLRRWHDNTWNMFFTRTYLLVDSKADINKLEQRGTDLFNSNKPAEVAGSLWEMQLQPLSDIHLKSALHGEFKQGGNARMNRILTIAAFFILLIAWLNYINLASAQALDRAREVGIRKVMGLQRSLIIKQFLMESLIINIVAVALSLLVVLLVRPYFSLILDVNLTYSYWNAPFIISLIVVFVFGAILSGLYPAFVMSSFNPLQTLKGKIGVSTGRVGVRKVLLGFQFAISALLIFITLIIYLQSNLLLKKDIGVDTTNTLVIRGSNLVGSDSVFVSRIEMFKNALLALPDVKSVTSTNSLPANTAFSDGVFSEIQREEDKTPFTVLYVDHNFLSSFNLEPIVGRTFSPHFPSDLNAAVITKSGVQTLGFGSAEEALNHKTNRDFGDKNKNIIGVVNDIQLVSWQRIPYPSIFYFNPNERRFFAVKLNDEINTDVVNKIQNVWEEYFGDVLFRYFSLDDSYRALYSNEVRNSRFLTLFSIFAIFVACVGLWGLALFTIVNRTKEIGIRKVIGFTALNIVNLINKEFIVIVAIACIVSIPIAWQLANKWLDSYSVRIEMYWWYALIPFLVVSIITIITISYHTIRTALANPVDAIRDE